MVDAECVTIYVYPDGYYNIGRPCSNCGMEPIVSAEICRGGRVVLSRGGQQVELSLSDCRPKNTGHIEYSEFKSLADKCREKIEVLVLAATLYASAYRLDEEKSLIDFLLERR